MKDTEETTEGTDTFIDNFIDTIMGIDDETLKIVIFAFIGIIIFSIVISLTYYAISKDNKKLKYKI